jgi:CBS domain containing-hemolysin-like protein
MPGLLISTFVVCLGVSFLLSGMETGVFALSRWRIRQQMRTGNRKAAALYGYLENPETFLWTILVGNTFANVAVASIAAVALHSYWGAPPPVFIAVFAAGVLLFYVLCELWPKMLFQLYPNRLCMALVGAFRVIHWILLPLVGLTAWMANNLLRWSGGRSFTGHLFGNRDELRMVMQESGQGLSSEERAMINRVLDLQNITVGQIMVPMAKVAGVAAETRVEEALQQAREHKFSRMPVWKTDGQRRRVAGLVTLRTLLYTDNVRPDQTVAEYLNPALYLNHDTRLEVALRQMQRAGQRLAIVLGPNGTEVGVLSLQDILRVIFGEVSL